ncbi:MAG TPA: hypothetical protein VN457_03360 [Chlamydiales bacterium]|nr:hypothetical protein [Chlamydiales bacterium]
MATPATSSSGSSQMTPAQMDEHIKAMEAQAKEHREIVKPQCPQPKTVPACYTNPAMQNLTVNEIVQRKLQGVKLF